VCRRGIYHDVDRYKQQDQVASASRTDVVPGITKVARELQFSRSVLSPNGDLKKLAIPEPLKYARPFEMTTLSNGIRVCTESWPARVASVGVVIGAGSRHETLETAGTAHFMEHLHFKVGFRTQFRAPREGHDCSWKPRSRIWERT
jgi:hypothetical protein